MIKYIILFLMMGYSFSAYSKIKIFTTTSNLADIVRIIGGDEVSVESLCKGIQDPHYLEAKPSYTFKLSKADLLVSIGLGLEEGWLPLVIRGSRNPNIREGEKGRLVASRAINLLEIETSSISRSQGDVHPGGNPHFMLSPQRAIEVAQLIYLKLSDFNSAKKSVFHQRFKNFESKLNKKIKEWKGRIEKGKNVISYHKTLTYFYNDFGINNVDVLEPKPGIPPSASHILKIISKIKKENVKKIVIENYFDDTIAKRIKKDVSDVQIVVVPVAVGGKDGIIDIFSLYEYLVSNIGTFNGSI